LTNIDNNMTQHFSQLSYLGCTEQEIRTFSAILGEPGGVTVRMLAKKMGTPRPTVYGYIDSLLAKGLIKKGLGDDGAQFWVESPVHVAELYDECVRSATHAKKQLLQELAEYGSQQNETHRPRLFFYENPDAAKEVLRDTLRSREQNIYWFWPIRDMLKVIPSSVFASYHEERARRGIRLHVLWPASKKISLSEHPELGTADTEESLREIRILPNAMNVHLGYGIYGNRVACIASRRESYGFILESPEFAQTLREQFMYWWERSEVLS
jgi:sugar-specific transcriptional regulator TrmB